MKIIRQIGIIFLVCWLSEVIERFLPFTFPASVIGMALLLICLLTGVLKIRHIQEKADFLLENMAFFFIPAGVSIINYFDILKSSAVQLLIICVISTVVTFAATAWSVKLTMRCMSLAGHGGTGSGPRENRAPAPEADSRKTEQETAAADSRKTEQETAAADSRKTERKTAAAARNQGDSVTGRKEKEEKGIE